VGKLFTTEGKYASVTRTFTVKSTAGEDDVNVLKAEKPTGIRDR
jgi:hypothetical protein